MSGGSGFLDVLLHKDRPRRPRDPRLANCVGHSRRWLTATRPASRIGRRRPGVAKNRPARPTEAGHEPVFGHRFGSGAARAGRPRTDFGHTPAGQSAHRASNDSLPHKVSTCMTARLRPLPYGTNPTTVPRPRDDSKAPVLWRGGGARPPAPGRSARSFGRQHHLDSRPLSDLISCADLAPVSGDEVAGDGQAQAATARYVAGERLFVRLRCPCRVPIPLGKGHRASPR